jgi:hypothetical protein
MPGGLRILGLGEDPPAASHHRIGAENEGAAMTRRHLRGLGFG